MQIVCSKGKKLEIVPGSHVYNDEDSRYYAWEDIPQAFQERMVEYRNKLLDEKKKISDALDELATSLASDF